MAATRSGSVAPPVQHANDDATRMEEIRARFDEAAGRVDVFERSYEIAGHAVHLRIAGDAAACLLSAAFEHHRPAPRTQQGLTIHAWDIGATGVAAPDSMRPVRGAAAGTPPVPRDGSDRGRIRIGGQGPGRRRHVYDRDRQEAFHCIADPRRLIESEIAQPFFLPFHWWMEDLGGQLVHAAGIGRADGGMLIVAPGGSGKSSTALATLATPPALPGFGLLGEDYCLLTLDPEPVAWSLYGTGKLLHEQADRYPDLVTGPVLNADQPTQRKVVFLPSRRHPDRMVPSFPIRCLVVPVINGGPPGVEPITPAAAIRSLAPSTIFQLPGAGAHTMAILARLARQVPAFALRLPPDPRDAPPLLAQLLAEVNSGA